MHVPSITDLSMAAPRPWPSVSDVALSAAAFFAQVVAADSHFTLVTDLYAGLEAATLVLLVTRYIRVRPPRLPWIELMYALQYSEFGLILITEPAPAGVMHDILPRPESFEFGSLVALLGGLAMVAGFAAIRRTTPRLRGDSLLPKLDPETLNAGSRVYLLIAIPYVLLNASAPAVRAALLPVAGLIQTVFYLVPLVVVATITYLARPSGGNLTWLSAAFATTLLATATSSMLGDTILPFTAVAVLWWRGKERVPLIPIALAVIVVVVLQPVKVYYRGIKWVDRPDAPGVAAAWGEAFSEAATDSQLLSSHKQTGSEATIERMGELSSLAYVVEMVPASIPHSGGLVYPMMLTAMVPRVLWPDKPNMTKFGLDPFVIALGLSSPEGAETSTAGISLVAQGYFEHGVAGSVGWMALFGAISALFSRYFGTKLAGTVAGAAVLVPWSLAASGGFFNIFGGVWQTPVGATLLPWTLWMFGGGFRRQRGAKH